MLLGLLLIRYQKKTKIFNWYSVYRELFPKKTIGDNLNYTFDYVYDDENYSHRLLHAGNLYYQYDSNGNVLCEQDGSFESNGDDVNNRKISEEADGIYSTDYGWGLFRDSDSGKNNGRYRRTYTWNERNQLICSKDASYTTNYIYGQDGQRTNKYTARSETLYFNKMWTLHTDSGNSVYGGQNAKNIYLGDTRIVTKLARPIENTIHEEYYKQYYYHSDHLGSASLISDYKGDEYQRIEYTPYGETWVEKSQNTGLEYLPYKFTGQMKDEETGNYYIGARYLQPQTCRWLSSDPAVGDYLSKTSEGEGGIYNSVNLNLYHYAGNSPINFSDPTGCWTVSAGIGKGVAVKVKFGHNEGKWELSWRVGFGLGAELSIDISDSSFTDESKIGVYAEIDGGIESGAYSLDLSAQVGIECVIDSENNSSIEYPNNAEVSAPFNGEISGSITIDHGELEINPPSFNTEKSADIGAGAMIFMGFGGEGVLKNDE